MTDILETRIYTREIFTNGTSKVSITIIRFTIEPVYLINKGVHLSILVRRNTIEKGTTIVLTQVLYTLVGTYNTLVFLLNQR